MKIGIYARVSTSDKNQDPENQLRELRAYCKPRGFEILKEYVDVGQSGAKDSRPKLNELLNDARKRKIDAILVWRMDRFSRDLKFLITTIDSLNQIGIGFISYHENIDLTTAAGRLQMQVFSAFAEYEKNVIKERVLSGLAKARSEGRVGGRPQKNLDMHKIYQLHREGLSLGQISKKIGIPKSTVAKRLKTSRTQNPLEITL